MLAITRVTKQREHWDLLRTLTHTTGEERAKSSSNDNMQWATATHGPEGKVLADGRTLAYIGRGNHARDAMCVRTTQPVSSMPYVHHHRATTAKHTAGSASPPPSHAKSSASQSIQSHTQHTRSSSDNALSSLQLFYYETLIVSTCDDDDDNNRSSNNNGNGNARDGAAATPLDVRTEMDLLMARVNGLARSSSSSPTSPPFASASVSSTSATSGHADNARLPWRARARRIVLANLLVSEPLLRPAHDSEQHDDNASERMELDNDTRNSNGNHALTRATDQASAALSSRSSTTMRHRTSGAINSRSGATATSHRGATDASSLASSSALHFAFTLSSRTMQQIRSRHERRRARRQEALKRFNHRIAVGFAFVPKTTTTATSRSGASPDRECESLPSTSSLSKVAVVREDLGTDAHSLAYEGKTGRIVSNGHVFLQCERFGAGDVVGCGLLVDTQTFFFTLNGRLLGLLAATDVHHLDALVDSDDAVRSRSVASARIASTAAVTDNESDDDTGAFDPDDCDASGTSSGTDDDDGDYHALDMAAAFDDVVFPAVSLHGAGECVSAAFTSFQFDLPAFAQQIQKERQLALMLHETADERDDRATDDVLHDFVLEYFSHFGYENAYQALAATNSSNGVGYGRSTRAMDIDGDEHKTSELTDAALLHLRHCVRQHVYAHETAQALELLTATLGSAFFAEAATTTRGATVLFYTRVLCVLDVLLGHTDASPPLDANHNHAQASPLEPRSSTSWRVEDAIACARALFASGAESVEPSPASASVADTELPLVLPLLLYERKDDVPVDSAARKFLTPAFREHVADELNLLVLAQAATHTQRPGKTSSRQAPAALQQFLEERQVLETQCLQHGCRVFPGNHTVSSVCTHGSSRKASRRRHHHRHHRLSLSSSSETGGNDNEYSEYDDDDDEHMRSSSSGSDLSSSSSRSDHNEGEHDDDDDEDDDAMDEDDE